MDFMETIIRESQESFDKARDKWIMLALDCNVAEEIEDLQDFIDKNDVKIAYSFFSKMSYISIGQNHIGTFYETPHFTIVNGEMKFTVKYWIKNSNGKEIAL